ncbi:phosphotransferase enzyme family protein [Pseudomonas sp. ABY48]|uniref:phosphotransferase enzyme family protein n=1 Tax=Pseudomonas sp. ABY48 TaxID=3402865 RepID=UPI003B42A7F8
MTLSRELSVVLLNDYNLQANGLNLTYDGTNKIIKFHSGNLKYVLKLFPANCRTSYQIQYERQLIMHLIVQGIECPKPIPPCLDREESVFKYLNQDYYGLLTHESKGVPFSPENDHSQIPAFGRALIRLHNCSPFPLKNHLPYLTDPTKLMEGIKRDASTQLKSRLESLILKLYSSIQTHPIAPESNDTSCICHGDAWPGNALYSENSCVLLDFEHSRISTPAFDISTFLWWALDQHDDIVHIDAWRKLKIGYGDCLDRLLSKNTSRYIKINELRSLIFLHNHIDITDELFDHINERALWIMKILPSASDPIKILELA